MLEMKIGTRLGGAFSIVVLIFIAVLTLVGVQLIQIKKGVQQIKDESLIYLLIADDMSMQVSDVQQHLTDVAVTHDSEGYNGAEAAAKKFKEDVARFKEMYTRENDTESLKQLNLMNSKFQNFYNLGKEMAKVYTVQGIEAGNAMMKKFDTLSEDLVSSIRKFREQQKDEAIGITEHVSLTMGQLQIMIIVTSIIGVILSSLLSFWIVRYVLQQLGGEPVYVKDIVQKIASGDLTIQVITRDGDDSSIMAAMKNMTVKLSQIIGEVDGMVNTLSQASEEVSATAQNMNQSTLEQSTNMEETSSSLEQMKLSIDQNAGNAQATDEMTTQVVKQASEGGLAVKRTIEAMKKIADSINLVDDIAYQTNLLALNAAIEAARAGEHGKGFAVVASEVRKLAEHSQNSSKEISETATNSVALSERAGQLLDEILPVIGKTSDMMKEITVFSTEQANSVGQINNAMEQISQITQQNASSSEELAATSEELSTQAAQLQKLMAFFKRQRESAGS